MPKDDKRKELTQEEIDAQNEKFRTFFSTSVAQVPEEMKRRDEEKESTGSLLGKLFHREKDKEEPAAAPAVQNELPPTGEIVLGHEEEAEAGLELALEPGELEEAEPVALPTAPEAPAAPKPEPRPAPQPEKKPEPPRRREPLTPQEQQEDAEMAELKAMLYGTPKPAPVEEVQDAPEEVLAVEPEAPAAPEGPAIPMVFAEDQSVKQAKSAPEAAPEVEPEPETAFQFFGKGADENEPQAPTRTEAPSKDDSMSLPLMGLEEDEAPARPAAPAEEAPAQPAEEAAPAAPEAAEKPAEEAEPETPEQVGEKLRRMGAELTLRCVLEGILAVVLLHFGLVAEGLLAPVASLDPVIAPAAFYAANLLFLAGALAVGWPVLRDGLQGLKGRPSADTMPALAACGALVQAAVALLNAQSYQNSSWTLLSGVAALGLFLALLGSRVLLTAVRNGYDLAARSPEGLQGAFRVRDKDLIRVLARSLDQKDPWVLLSRPVQWDEALVEQSFGERASERRARKTALILLGAAVLREHISVMGMCGIALILLSLLVHRCPPPWLQASRLCACKRPLPPPVPWCPAGPPLRSWAVWTPCRWMPTSSLPPTA